MPLTTLKGRQLQKLNKAQNESVTKIRQYSAERLLYIVHES